MSYRFFITGASSGIGYATAVHMLELGHYVVACGRKREKLERLQAHTTKSDQLTLLSFDVSKEDEVARAIQTLCPSQLPIHVLINNAGNAHGLSTIDQDTMTDTRAMIDSNLLGLLNVTHYVLPLMYDSGKKHIVNVSSIAGKEVYKMGAVYCATKHAVEALSEGMRKDLLEKGFKVTNIAPGMVHTEFSLTRFKGEHARADKVYKGMTPLYAKDVADAIAYAVFAPKHVQIADLTILAAQQSGAIEVFRNL